MSAKIAHKGYFGTNKLLHLLQKLYNLYEKNSSNCGGYVPCRNFLIRTKKK